MYTGIDRSRTSGLHDGGWIQCTVTAADIERRPVGALGRLNLLGFRFDGDLFGFDLPVRFLGMVDKRPQSAGICQRYQWYTHHEQSFHASSPSYANNAISVST